MTQPTITQLSAQNFRGIRRASIPLGGTNLVLVGENGSGKSCFVDALEYLFSGQLARMKRQDVKEKESIPFVGQHVGEPVSVTISLGLDGSIHDIGTGYPYSEPEPPAPVSAWFQHMRAHSPILRRAQILDFVEAKGASRYKQISTIIGLDDVDDILSCWRKLETEAKRRREILQENLYGAQQTLRDLLHETGQADLVHGVNYRMAEVGMAPISDIGELDERQRAFALRADATTAAQEAVRLSDYASAIDSIGKETRSFLADYAEFHDAWTVFTQQKDAWNDALFRELLDQGLRILSELPDLEVCPLCEAPIGRVQLLERLRPRIAELDAIRERKDALEKSRTEVAEQATRISQEVRTALSAGDPRSAACLTELAGGLEQMAQVLTRNILDGQYPAPTDVRGSPWVAALSPLAEASSSLQDEACKLKPPELEQKRVEVATWLGEVKQARHDEEAAAGAIGVATRICDHLELMCKAVTQAREECLTGIHADIESKINDYYQQLHPEEGYGEVQLPVERKGQAVGLRTAFHGAQASHPAGFYSEGHLDCVGIAVFLAFMHRANPDGGLLVLDDVMTTIDSAHRQRLAMLLAKEFAGHQLIITTHDRLWAEQLLTTMRAYGLRRLALHLQPWTVDRGVEWVELLEQRWGEYAARAETDPQSAVGDSGRDLEKLLCMMRYNLMLSVPARIGDQYTIGDLYDPFFAWFRKRSVQRTDVAFDEQISLMRQQMDAYWRVRNWSGAHYNTWGATLSPSEAKDFIILVEALHKLFQCPRCGSLVRYEEDSSVLYCAKCSGKQGGASWRVVKKAGEVQTAAQ